jgi:N-acetylmuramoyl-L-alanine amidase
MRIYIDPGHGKGTRGQRDPGAVGPGGTTENAVVLDVGKRLGHLLRAGGHTTLGATLAAAVDTENLNEAIAAANAARADLYISLHCNAAANPVARGVEVWHDGSPQAHALALAILQHIGEQLTAGRGQWVGGTKYPLTNRGAKRGTFAVLRNTRMPAVLVELAFISNSLEEAWLNEKTVRQQFAQAIADAVGR